MGARCKRVVSLHYNSTLKSHHAHQFCSLCSEWVFVDSACLSACLLCVQTFLPNPYSFKGGGTEMTMAESSNGTVIAMLRINEHGDQSTKGRLRAASTDGGVHFTEAAFDENLKSVACQASLLRSNASGKIYYSAPSSLSARQRGLVRSSVDGLDWSDQSGFALTRGDTDFGYSCLTELPTTSVPPNKFLGVLWEKQARFPPLIVPTCCCEMLPNTYLLPRCRCMLGAGVTWLDVFFTASTDRWCKSATTDGPGLLTCATIVEQLRRKALNLGEAAYS
jgi:hypothetical protein